MEDFMTLVKRGVIYDGCPIIAKGTVRIKDGDVCIDTKHELMSVDGKNFAYLCEPGKHRTEQGQLTDETLEDWKAKVAELKEEKAVAANGMQIAIANLQAKLDHEYSLRASIEGHLEREKQVSSEAAQVIHDAKAKLAAKVEEVEMLQNKLSHAEGLVKELESRLESEGSLLEQRGMKIQSLLNEKESSSKNLEVNLGREESLREQLDSTVMILGEKEEKLQNLQQQLGQKDEKVKEVIEKQKDAKVVAAELQNQVALLEAERIEDKKNSAMLLDDFSQWRSSTEEELASMKKQLENNKTTITTLKNELEIAELEESEFNASISALQKENNELRKQLQLATVPPEPVEKVSRKIRTSQSLKNFVKITLKPKDKDKDASESKKEKKDKTKRHSIASAPSL